VESVCAPKKLRDFKNSAKKSSREPARFRATVDSEDEQSGLLTRITATESALLCVLMRY
jgi:hypothetical protein